ncbi:2OG-Fe(II) oxygenase [Streptomyces sp. NPDC059255]|uniref:2OG-Fe(II) oxygenase family protein n=1 Tax=Streptomyces sp. NPDC059255 TaxID=3346793 RepID=UPI0036A9BBAB
MRTDLNQLLDGRRWLLREFPFRHIWAESVFAPALYEQMIAEFRHLLGAPDGHGFQRNMPGYDATGHSFRPGYRGAFDIFFSAEFRRLMSTVSGAPITCDMDAGLHHHRPGARSGRVHNDLSPGWFLARSSSPSPDATVNLSDSARCNYRSGETPEPGVEVVEMVRALALIYYLDNGPWLPGNGGETGLYLSNTVPVTEPASLVPPKDNSMLAFECTPRSFHTYLESRRTRNSPVLWWHRPKEDATSRWGEEAIASWPRGQRR